MARTSAAPVGVVISPSMSPANTGMSRSMSAVAGAGTGSMPCAQRTWPKPVRTGETTILSGASMSSSQLTPTTSATASIAPTSWKCTSPTSRPCTALSALAISV